LARNESRVVFEAPGANQRIQHAILGIGLCLGLDLFAALFARQTDPGLYQVTYDLLNVPADIADLCKLGCFDLYERCVGQLGQPASNLGLAHAGRPDHEDVLWHDLVTQTRLQLLATPPVAKRNGHHALGIALPDDMAVQL
jgi:hypothetical protein